MRIITLGFFAMCLAGCGGSNETPADLSAAHDMSAAADMTAGADMTTVAPFNMPGKVYCYNGPLCSTTSATPICCDSKGDGGFTDTCVASAAACTAMDSKAGVFQCGQAADCGTGMVCCGDVGMSSSGKPFIDSSTCAASCGASLTQLCVATSECTTSGTSCVGESATGRNIGVCK